MKEMGGGAGLKYAASTIIYLTKSKEKEGTDLVGNIIKCEAKNLDLHRRVLKLLPDYTLTNVDWTNIMDSLNWVRSTTSLRRVGNRISIGGSNVYPKSILSDPEKYFTDEVMAKLEEAARTEYSYGN